MANRFSLFNFNFKHFSPGTSGPARSSLTWPTDIPARVCSIPPSGCLLPLNQPCATRRGPSTDRLAKISRLRKLDSRSLSQNHTQPWQLPTRPSTAMRAAAVSTSPHRAAGLAASWAQCPVLASTALAARRVSHRPLAFCPLPSPSLQSTAASHASPPPCRLAALNPRCLRPTNPAYPAPVPQLADDPPPRHIARAVQILPPGRLPGGQRLSLQPRPELGL